MLIIVWKSICAGVHLGILYPNTPKIVQWKGSLKTMHGRMGGWVELLWAVVGLWPPPSMGATCLLRLLTPSSYCATITPHCHTLQTFYYTTIITYLSDPFPQWEQHTCYSYLCLIPCYNVTMPPYYFIPPCYHTSYYLLSMLLRCPVCSARASELCFSSYSRYSFQLLCYAPPAM